tara:strand:- start:919 stop:1083 length:165 start_codon:yes stop_codon:yes gene_type:complete
MNAVQTAKKQVYSSKDPITAGVGKDLNDLMKRDEFPEAINEDTTYIAGANVTLE